MTMLTPLGTGARSRRRVAWVRVMTALVVLALVGGGTYLGWSWWDGREADQPSPAASSARTCTTPTPRVPRQLPEPQEITVAVANGTTRSGLAVTTADALVERGFDVTDIGNTDQRVGQGVGVVRYRAGEPSQLGAAVVVASVVPGAQLREVSGAKEAEVALWLGPDFEGLASRADADPASAPLPRQDPSCRNQR